MFGLGYYRLSGVKIHLSESLIKLKTIICFSFVPLTQFSFGHSVTACYCFTEIDY